MKWRLEVPHYIDEQVLPPGTLVGDDTEHPYAFTQDDAKLGRKVGEPMPPSTGMTPMDEEARAVYRKKFGDSIPERDPLKSIPLTGAQGAPLVKPATSTRPGIMPESRQSEPAVPKTGPLAEGPKPTSTAPVGATPKV